MYNGYMDSHPNNMWEPMYPLRRGVDLAQAYVPYQQYMDSYPPMEALDRGTMFPELYSPYPPYPEMHENKM